eukprot:1152118-Pelagomonas_calceolata.AAC.5
MQTSAYAPLQHCTRMPLNTTSKISNLTSSYPLHLHHRNTQNNHDSDEDTLFQGKLEKDLLAWSSFTCSSTAALIPFRDNPSQGSHHIPAAAVPQPQGHHAGILSWTSMILMSSPPPRPPHLPPAASPGHSAAGAADVVGQR